MESVYPPEQRDLDLCIGGFGSGRVGLGCWSLGRGRHACIIYLPWQGRQAGRLAAGSFTFLSLLLVGWHFPPPNLMKQTIFSCCSVFGFVIFMAFLYGVEHPYLFCFFFFPDNYLGWEGATTQQHHRHLLRKFSEIWGHNSHFEGGRDNSIGAWHASVLYCGTLLLAYIVSRISGKSLVALICHLLQIGGNYINDMIKRASAVGGCRWEEYWLACWLSVFQAFHISVLACMMMIMIMMMMESLLFYPPGD